jgi:hypothetical protein
MLISIVRRSLINARRSSPEAGPPHTGIVVQPDPGIGKGEQTAEDEGDPQAHQAEMVHRVAPPLPISTIETVDRTMITIRTGQEPRPRSQGIG